MQAKNVTKTMISSNVCPCFSMIQKRTFACGLLAFDVRAKIRRCYKFNCVLNLQICNTFIHIYHRANKVTYITFALRTKLLCMTTFARHLTGVAWAIPTVTVQLYSRTGFSFEAGGGQRRFHVPYFDANKHLMNLLTRG